MILIWRGWGFLAAIIPLVFFALAMGLWSSATGAENAPTLFIGPAVALGGVGAFVLGRFHNGQGAVNKVDKVMAQRVEQVDHLVRSGQFQLAPGVPQARSVPEARQQADMMLEQERAQVAAAYKNRHTLFWIPYQWVGVAVAVLGLVITVMGVVTV